MQTSGSHVRQTSGVNAGPAEPPFEAPRYRQNATVAGWKEWASIPALGLPWVKAKLDTGARSSALHATDIELFQRDGSEFVRFTTHPWQGSLLDPSTVELPIVDTRQVKSSTGHSQIRAVIEAEVTLGQRTFVTEFTLTSRHHMGLRVLIGRQALRDRFLVDSGTQYACGRPPRAIRVRNRSTE